MRKIIDYIQILLIFLLTVVSAFLGTPLLFLGPKKALFLISRFWSFFLLKISGVSLNIDGKHNLNYDRPRIYVCNHESNIDIPCLMQSIDEPLFFIAKKELKKIPFLGWYMSAVGMIFIDRSDRKKAILSMKNASEEINKGKSVFSFPEGTRTRDGKVGMFKRGTFSLAINSNVDIVPIAIKGAKEVIPATKFEINPGIVKIKIGTPIPSDDWNQENVDSFAKEVKSKVIELQASI